MKTHYETLGVPKDATREQIKKAFRELSMETHPDVAKSRANAERFKQVSEAHAVLSNEKSRSRYDFEVAEAMRFGFHRRPAGASGSGVDRGGIDPFAGRNGGRPMTPSVAMHFLDGIYKPRNLFLGVTLGFAAVAFVKSCFAEDDPKKRTGKKKMVEAWKHPVTGEWQQPAPWDATYRKLQPELHMIPRDQVREIRR